uniref:ATP synthase F0 subunit 6 n=1 Tax=Litostrophus scaber TaxID=2259356 RepID=UPI00286A0FFB|nr:ATP synthase F0 subunit 6 [Litostrophus scaber]WKF19548.1 ATP synthase subunit 6 [Litostrophus scaber]
MMNNLFSIFDPSTNFSTSLNWLSVLLFFPIMFPPYWLLSSKTSMLPVKIKSILLKEFNILLGPSSFPGAPLILLTLFTFILLNNTMGLIPYIFTATSHLLLTLTLALPFWLTMILFGWLNNTHHMLAHLLPQGTPYPLMIFMVLIETISNFIRPITLSVRLTANMIAGHLLMTLLSNTLSSLPIMPYIMTLPTQLALITLESAVAMIQAYVFSVLTTLYISESN